MPPKVLLVFLLISVILIAGCAQRLGDAPKENTSLEELRKTAERNFDRPPSDIKEASLPEDSIASIEPW